MKIIKQLYRKAIIAATITVSTLSASAADAPVKREFRSAWVATVWRLDWPKTVISSKENTAQINKQKNELTTLLDSMAINNLNAVNFQVRSRADALYKSSYEPWSSDIVTTRGMDPGYDPLEFCVEECHKRGLECHAWINPYRFESVTGQWSGLPGDYRKDHPDWVQDVDNASILEPANPQVIKRICDIVREIVTNYDIDGILFDDYFYLQGVTDQDASWYDEYKKNGGTLELGDWRRENVNRMVDAVYATIKEIKPWVRFGISPAGIACTSNNVAQKYGVTPCPVGGDWQYNGIYSDPLAWISRRSLDFISPQIYWTIGSATDYDKAAEWWSQIANKWDRHFYSSHSISSLTASSKSNSLSGMERNIAYASGPNNTSFEEYANEVRLNREYTLNDAPGSIFYSAKYLYSTAPKFAHYLKTTVFNNQALAPALSWFPVASQGSVENVELNGNKLSWTAKENVRYTIYAVPENMPVINFNRQPEYLLGTSYSNNYTIDNSHLTGYKYAVCTLDRYGNEFAPTFAGSQLSQLESPVLTFPQYGDKVEMPFDFSWNPVNNATHYILSVATDPQMKNLITTHEVNSTSCSTSSIESIPQDTPLYWQVTAFGTNVHEASSATGMFTASRLEITAPANDSYNQSLTPVITWSDPQRHVTVQISKSNEFTENDIIFTAEVSNGSVTVPKYTLSTFTTYYVRLCYTRADIDCTTPVVAFTTLEMQPSSPELIHPANNGILHSDEAIIVQPTEGLRTYRIEVSASASFPSRQSYLSTRNINDGWSDSKNAGEIKINSKALVDGQKYNVRVRGSYLSESGTVNTGYSEPRVFTYSAAAGGVEDIKPADNSFSFNGNTLYVNTASQADVKIFSTSGVMVTSYSLSANNNGHLISLCNLLPGVYFATLNGNNTLKIVIR